MTKLPIFRGLTLALGLSATILFATAAGAQAESDETDLFFDTVDVNVVNVEVVVTDADGNPITGLGREDFVLYEDGEPVELSNFFAVEGGEALPPETREGDAAAIAPATRGLNLIVFVDELNLGPRNRNQIFENLRGVLEGELDPKTQVMVVSFNGRSEIAQEFTNDPAEIEAVLDQLDDATGRHAQFEMQKSLYFRQIDQTALITPQSGGDDLIPNVDSQVTGVAASSLAAELRNLAQQSYQKTRSTLEALEAFSNSLAGMRGRKAILYVSDGLPLRPAEPLVQAWLNKFEAWVLDQGETSILRELTSMVGTEYDASNDFDDLVSHLSTQRVVLYPITVAGRHSDSHVSAAFSGAGVSGLGARSADVVSMDNFSNESSLLRMAEGTGGVAFTRSANIGKLIGQISSDFSTFYSLGYSTPEREPGEFHEIEVEVARKGARVRHLEGYRPQDPLENLKDLTLSALHHGLEDNTLEMRLSPGEQEPSKGKRFQVPVMVQIPFQKLLLLPEAEHHTSQVTLYVVVQDLETGGVSEPQRIDLPIQIPNERLGEALTQAAAYPLQLDMKRGPKRIALGARDRLAQIDSTVCLELDVGSGG